MNAHKRIAGGLSPHGLINSIEFLGNGRFLHSARPLDIALRPDGIPERDKQIRLLLAGHLVAKGRGNRHGLLRDARDLGGSGLKPERSFGHGSFPALGKDPHKPPRLSEQPRREQDPRRPVRGRIQIHPKSPDQREKRQCSQILRVHQGIPIGLEQVLGQMEHHKRIPPRRVVRHDDHGCALGGAFCRVEPSKKDFAEGFVDAGARVPGEPSVEQRAFPGRNHVLLGLSSGLAMGRARSSIMEGSG